MFESKTYLHCTTILSKRLNKYQQTLTEWKQGVSEVPNLQLYITCICFFNSSVPVFTIVTVLLSVCVKFCVSELEFSFFTTLLAVAIVILCVILLTIWTHKFYLLRRHRTQCELELELIESFLASNKSFITVCRKSVRVVQETELVARGFTL